MYYGERDEQPPTSLCECGCGQLTKIASRTDAEKGWVKGRPFRFLKGHTGGAKRSEILYIIDKVTGCWLWQINIIRAGYGMYILPETGQKVYAHRWIYEKVKGPIPEGLTLDHRVTCPKRCVNPDHLEPVTQQVNTQRGRVAKLSPAAILEIRSSNLPARTLAFRYIVDRRQIYRVRCRENWGNI